jgi:neopullulanase
MRVVLDGVFNHASRGFWPFHHILENGPASPYLDWFIIHNWPLRPDSSAKEGPINYAAWWGLPALPKLNTSNPGVRQMIFDVARYWLEFGIDGWRLDVPKEINDDGFWQEFRRVVKGVNPEAYICGELWEDSRRWLQGDQFDAVMNYLFMWPALSFFGANTLRPYHRKHLTIKPLKAAGLAKQINTMHGLYDWQVNQAQLNLLDSHDTARALWIMGDDPSALRLCALFQMTMPGAPCIYYGDEVGMSAGDDPDCREAFPWPTPDTWNTDLLDFYRQATALRHRHPVLRTGSFDILHAKGNILAFHRQLPGSEAVVAFNAAAKAATVKLNLSPGQAFTPAWPPATLTPISPDHAGTIEIPLPPREAVVLLRGE